MNFAPSPFPIYSRLSGLLTVETKGFEEGLNFRHHPKTYIICGIQRFCIFEIDYTFDYTIHILSRTGSYLDFNSDVDAIGIASILENAEFSTNMVSEAIDAYYSSSYSENRMLNILSEILPSYTDFSNLSLQEIVNGIWECMNATGTIEGGLGQLMSVFSWFAPLVGATIRLTSTIIFGAYLLSLRNQ